MKGVILFIFIFLGFAATAQEGPKLLIPEVDSMQTDDRDPSINLQPVPGMAAPLPINDFRLPDFNYQQEMFNRYSVNPAVTSFQKFIALPEVSFQYSPFLRDGQVLSGSATQLSDKLVIGGFSYGANFMGTAPLPNQQGRQFDSYGSTMFMQYKVSKNFKIETRVSVGQSQGPPPPPGF